MFEVDFNHDSSNMDAIVRRGDRKQLWYSLVLLFKECIADLQTGFSLKKTHLGIYGQLYGNEIKIQNFS